MSAIAHGRQTAHTASPFTWNTNTSYQTVLTVAASNFVAGGKYLLLAMLGNWNVASTSRQAAAKTVHGSTDFAHSVMLFEALSATAEEGHQYLFATVFTQPGTAEDILIQAKTNDTAALLTVHAASLTWIRLDASLTENTDWYFGELSTDDAMSAAFETRASITIDDAGDWLIIGCEQIDYANATQDAQVRIVEDPSGTPVALSGVHSLEAKATTDQWVQTLFARRVLASGSVTVAVQDFGEADSHTHLHSAIFALNLDKFSQKATAAVDADGLTPDTAGVDITPDGWSDPTPTVTGDWLMLGFCIVDHDGLTRGAEVWIEAEGAGRTNQTPGSPRQLHSSDIAGEPAGVAVYMASLATGAARSIDFESDWSGTVSGVIKQRFLAAFSMELAAGGTLFQRSFAGSITPTGALVRKTKATKTGNITAAGSLTKKTRKTLIGSSTPTGTLATLKKLVVNLAGSITPTGSLTRRTRKTLTGNVTATGALTSKTRKAFSGAITPTGSLSRRIRMTFTGSITAVGNLTVLKTALAVLRRLEGLLTINRQSGDTKPNRQEGDIQ